MSDGYRPPMSMRYGMPFLPALLKRSVKLEESWLEAIEALRKQVIAESVDGLGRRPIDPAAFSGVFGRRPLR